MPSKKSKPEPLEFILTDTSHLQGESTQTVWVPVSKIPDLLWQENPKLHDIGATWESIVKYGFRDKSAIDMNLTNKQGEKGAFVYGNGRNESVYWGWTQYHQGDETRIPKGILYDESGEWYIPTEIGLDADSESMAQAFGLDHNNLTVMGGDIDISMLANLYDKEQLATLAKSLGENMTLPITFDGQDANALFAYLDNPDFDFGDDYEEPNSSQTGEPNEAESFSDIDSGIRMVQLYFNADTIEEFSSCVKRLGELYDLENVTDIVLEALIRETDNG